MRLLKKICVFAFISAALPASCEEFGDEANDIQYVFFDETPVINLLNWKIASGDSFSWSSIEYDDALWKMDKGSGLWVESGLPAKGICWYRKTIFLPEALPALSMLAIYQIAAVSANEIYWDGRQIAANGMVGASLGEEIPGRSAQIFPVQASLATPGKHVIAVRMSNRHAFSGCIFPPLRLGYFTEIQTRMFRNGALALFLAGIFVITALFHLAILLGHSNKWTYALFSAFCISCAAYIIIQSMLHYFQVDLRYYYSLAALNDVPWFLMMSLLPIFFLFEFTAPYRIALSAVILSLTLVIVLLPRLATFGVLPFEWLAPLDRVNRIHSISTIVASIAVSLWAIRRKRAGSLTIAVGLVIFLFGAYVSYRTQLQHGWAVGFAFLILVITISLSRQMAERNRQHHHIQLRSARLELELLKRHIQPHFLLNSLNSIVAWLEEEPATAAKLVNALADELRMLLDLSGKQTISLTQELHLCEAHLKVMSLRQEKNYELTVDGVDGSEQLPPLVIHTLVENGLTHGYAHRHQGIFRLHCESNSDLLKLVLFNDSAPAAAPADYVEGTGLRYVRTRLEEAYPGAWSLTAGPVENGWQVIIEIRRENI